jgi:hypothetical protein
MNFLESLLNWLPFHRNTQTQRPGWRHSGYRQRKSRMPFHSSRRKVIAASHLKVEQFLDKDARLARFQELRGKEGLCKWSTARDTGAVDDKGRKIYDDVWLLAYRP